MAELLTHGIQRRVRDLGTFIPHVIAALTVAGLAPATVLFGFGAVLIATGLLYGVPLPVLPMKAVSAVILTGGLRPSELTTAGTMIASCCSCWGSPDRSAVSRAVPQSVSAGSQLGLGFSMGALGLKLILQTRRLGFGSVTLQ